MREITLSELDRLQGSISEADEALQMDQESFCALYERTARPLWVYLWRRTGDSQLADDLLQETYYRFLRTRGVLESEKHRKNYLFRIAANLAHDDWRRRRRFEPLSEEQYSIASGQHSGSDAKRDLEQALGKLEARQRDAVWMAYAEGSSHEEIAAILGLKVQTVKTTLFRARRKLAALLLGGKR
jgi:RNA polymerase sigma-70 factor, ECF subfamily